MKRSDVIPIFRRADRWPRRLAILALLTGGPTQAAGPGAHAVGELALQPATSSRATEQMPATVAQKVGPVSILQVRPDTYMLTLGDLNVAVQTGSDGTLVVDTGDGSQCAALVAAVKAIASGPIRYLINTSAHPDRAGCNAELANAGTAFMPGINAFAAPIIAHENAMLQLVEGKHAVIAIPTETFTRPQRDSFMNGQPVSVIWMPNAYSSGDSVVLFRRSDVVVTGHVFDATRFPQIDVENGGSIQGAIAAANRLLNELTVQSTPRWRGHSGTLIIPVRGHLSNQADVLNYREMLTNIRNRIQRLVDQGKTLDEVKAADPTAGYAARYGADKGDWTTKDFVVAVYQSLRSDSRQTPERNPQ